MFRVYLLYCLSGFVSLGYQVVWFRVGVDRFGSTNFTFALVLCNFIAGLGIGALVSKPFADRIARLFGLGDRLRVYGLVEILVGLSALITIASAAIPADAWGVFPYVLRNGIHEQTLSYQFGQVAIAAICVFLPCFFMGVTFPLLCYTFRRDGRCPSALYAWNTLGASSGVLVCEFLLLPSIGHDATLWIMAGLNVGLGAFFLARGGAPEAADAEPESPPQPEPAAAPSGTFGFVLICVVLSGFLSGAVEADMLKRVWFVGGTTNAAMSFVSFWAIAAIFLASSAVRLLRGLRLVHIKFAFALALVAYWLAWRFAYPLQPYFNYLQGLGSILGYVGLFVFPAFFGLSLLLPYVLNRVQSGRRHLGLVYGANTLAFCLGMVGFSWIAPRVNVFYSMKLAMLLFAVGTLFLWLLSERRPTPAWKPIAAALLFGLACAFTPAGFDASYCGPANPAAHFPIRAMRSNGAHTTYIIELPDGDTLTFDNHPMSGTQIEAQTYMRLMAHFPLLAQEHPERALLICFGVGNTASAIAAHGTIRAIDVVDLNEQVIATAPEFAATSNAVHLDPRVTFIHDDGRNWLNITDRKYDLITSEPPPPMQSGVYRLYSLEYYERALEHLTPQGLMTQWLPIYQMPPRAVELAISTFVAAFPYAILFTGREREFILMGGPAPIDLARVERRFHEQPAVVADLARVRVHSPLSLLARVVKGEPTLRREFGGRGLIRDQRNDLAYLFLDPTQEAVISYDPHAMLADVGVDGLAQGPELRAIVMDLGRLQYWVDEFPVDSLLSVRALGADSGVRLADVDWRRARGLLGRMKRVPGPAGAAQREDLMRRSLAICEEQPRVHLALAQLLAQTRRFDAALESLRRFQVLEPREAIGFFGAGQALLGLGREAAALDALRRAVELAPARPEFQLGLATLLQSRGTLDEAIAAFRAAVKLEPASIQAHYKLAGAQAAAGRRNAAIKQLRIAAALADEANSTELAAQIRAQLEQYDE